MQRKFVTNLVFLLLINLLVKPFWIFGIDREVQNMLGNEVYGEYFVLFNFSLLLNILLDLGLTNFNNRNIAQNRQLLNKHFSGILALKILLGILYLLVTLCCAFYFRFSAHRVHLLSFLVINQFLISFVLYLRSNMAGLHLFKTDGIISVLDRFLMILFCSMLIWGDLFGGNFRIEWFVYAQTLAYLLTALIAFGIVSSKATFQRISWNRAFLAVILKQSLPYALLILLMSFYNRMDSVMLDLMLEDGARESGLYAQGYRLLDAVNMIGFLTAGLLYPIFAFMLKNNREVRELVRLSFGFLAAISVPVAILSWLHAEPLMQLLYEEGTGRSAGIFKLLMGAFIPVSISYIFGTLLTAGGKLKLLNWIAVFGVILNFVLNYIFIPSYGAIGSAYTTLATQYAATLLQVAAVFYLFRFRSEWRFFGLLLFFIFLCLAAGIGTQYFFTNWMAQALTGGLLMLLFAFLTGLINIRSLLQTLKYDKE